MNAMNTKDSMPFFSFLCFLIIQHTCEKLFSQAMKVNMLASIHWNAYNGDYLCVSSGPESPHTLETDGFFFCLFNYFCSFFKTFTYILCIDDPHWMPVCCMLICTYICNRIHMLWVKVCFLKQTWCFRTLEIWHIT